MKYRAGVLLLTVALCLALAIQVRSEERNLVKRRASPFFKFLFPRRYKPQPPPVQYIYEDHDSPKIVIRPVKGKLHESFKPHLHKFYSKPVQFELHKHPYLKNAYPPPKKPHFHKDVHSPHYEIYPAVKDVHIEHDVTPQVIQVKPIKPFANEFDIPFDSFPPVKQHIHSDFKPSQLLHEDLGPSHEKLRPSQPIHEDFDIDHKPKRPSGKLVRGPNSEFHLVKFGSDELQHSSGYYNQIVSNAIYRLDYPRSRIVGIKNFHDKITDDLIPGGVHGLDEETLDVIKKAAKLSGLSR